MSLLVTLGTEGTTNWVRLPDGQKFNLGPVSILSFVTKLALGGNRSARSILDGFLAGKEVLLRVDEDRMWELLAPRRTRWASDSFMTVDHRRRGTDMTIDKDLGVLEAHVQKLHQAAEAKVPPHKMAEGVSILVKLAKSIGNFDDALEGSEALTVEAIKTAAAAKDFSGLPGFAPLKGLSPEKQLEIIQRVIKKNQSELKKLKEELGVKSAYDTHKANTTLATQILDQMEDVNGRIDELVTAGKKFNATKAKADAHAVTSKIAGIVNEVDLTVPWVAEDLKKLAAQAGHLHGLFFPKK
jgi:hypothetical protein